MYRAGHITVQQPTKNGCNPKTPPVTTIFCASTAQGEPALSGGVSTGSEAAAGVASEEAAAAAENTSDGAATAPKDSLAPKKAAENLLRQMLRQRSAARMGKMGKLWRGGGQLEEEEPAETEAEQKTTADLDEKSAEKESESKEPESNPADGEEQREVANEEAPKAANPEAANPETAKEQPEAELLATGLPNVFRAVSTSQTYTIPRKETSARSAHAHTEHRRLSRDIRRRTAKNSRIVYNLSASGARAGTL